MDIWLNLSSRAGLWHPCLSRGFGNSKWMLAFILQAPVDRERLSKLQKEKVGDRKAGENCEGVVFLGVGYKQERLSTVNVSLIVNLSYILSLDFKRQKFLPDTATFKSSSIFQTFLPPTHLWY